MRSEMLLARVTLSCPPPRQGCIRQIMHCRENKLYQLSWALRSLRKELLDLKKKKKKVLIFYSCVSLIFPEKLCRGHRQPPQDPQNVVNLGLELLDGRGEEAQL